MSALWSPSSERPIMAIRPQNSVPGTWLSLLPAVPQTTQLAKLSPSPAIVAETEVVSADELDLNAENAKFLSNSSSRSSSMSTEAMSAPRHPPLGQSNHYIPATERREATVGRGISSAFTANR